MREQMIQVVEQYFEAVRNNDVAALPLHPDAICEFPTNTYRGAASFRKGLDDFARIMDGNASTGTSTRAIRQSRGPRRARA